MSSNSDYSFFPILENYDSWSRLEQYSLEFIRRHKVIKVGEDDSSATLAAIDETDCDQLASRLRSFHGGKEIRFVYSDSADFHAVLARLHSQNQSDSGIGESVGDSTSLETITGDAPTVNLVNGIILEAVQAGASDIHIEPEGVVMRVRYRIDGSLRKVSSYPYSRFESVSSRIKLMANLNIMEQRKPQDGRLTVTLGGIDIHMRLSVVPLVQGESLVLRIFRKADDLLDPDTLGLSGPVVSQLRDAFTWSNGLLLVTGPTGSGKTTTLDAFLNEIRDISRKIITIEDPVEYIIDGIEQIQVNESIGLGFSTLLRRILRQDPDVIMVGEIRDSETASLAVRAALTGHLVLATLHTNDAASAILRLVDMGVPRYLLAAVLKGVLAQRLVRCLCPKCGATDAPGRKDKEALSLWGEAIGKVGVCVGCPSCENTGYTGRTAVSEWFSINDDLAEIIARRDSRTSDLRAYLDTNGFIPILNDALGKIASGITTIDEIRRRVAG